MKKILIISIIAFCIIPAIVLAATWYDDYGTTRKITLTTSSGDLTNFVYVLNYSDLVDTAGFIGDGLMLSTCKDLRITDDDNSTLLKYEFEDYDDGFGCNQNNTLLWVKTPYLFANNSSVNWFYYNNSSETAFGNETNNTWSDYILVNHFSYEGVANWSNGSTSNMFDFQIFGNGTITNASFGDGILCKGALGDIANTTSQTVLNGLGDKNFTIEFWFNAETGSTGDDWFFNKWVGADKTFLFLYSSNKIRFLGYDGAEHDIWSSAISADTWYYFAVVQNSTHLLIYKDGVLDNTTAYSGALQNNTAPISVCGQPAGSASLNGFLDEVRIHDTDLSADYFKRTYENRIVGMAGLGGEMSIPAVIVPKSIEQIWGFQNLAIWLCVLMLTMAGIGMIIKATKY